MTTPTMAEQLAPGEVWAVIQPLLPAKPPQPKGVSDLVDAAVRVLRLYRPELLATAPSNSTAVEAEAHLR